MAISIDNLARSHDVFVAVMRRSLPQAQAYLDQNVRSDYVALVLRGEPKASSFNSLKAHNARPPLHYPLIVFHPNGDIEEYSELPYKFDLHEHGRSFIYTKNSRSWWSGDLTHTRSEDVPPTFRAFLLIL